MKNVSAEQKGFILEMLSTNDKLFKDADMVKFICSEYPEVSHEAFQKKEVRRNIKKQMKAFVFANSPDPFGRTTPNCVVNEWKGFRKDYFDSYEQVFIILGDIDNAKAVLDGFGYPWEGVEIHSAYDCTGRWFAWEADFIELPDRVIVKQHWGLDV
jgi:hypothetical protein